MEKSIVNRKQWQCLRKLIDFYSHMFVNSFLLFHLFAFVQGGMVPSYACLSIVFNNNHYYFFIIIIIIVICYSLF
jgi:hypothetical protein